MRTGRVTFENRREAGRLLAQHLAAAMKLSPELVLGLARGGVPVAHEVATAMRLPLDVFVIRKLGLPGHEELAMGAIGSGGALIVNEYVLQSAFLPKDAFAHVLESERLELRRREQLYRRNRPPLEVNGKTVLLVDDGLATGASMRSGVLALKNLGARSVVAAVPVASPDALALLAREAGETHSILAPPSFGAVGEFYSDFTQTTDDEVIELLENTR